MPTFARTRRQPRHALVTASLLLAVSLVALAVAAATVTAPFRLQAEAVLRKAIIANQSDRDIAADVRGNREVNY